MAELIIEILDRHDRVTERYKVNKFPFRIGRGYGNDLILSDPYVCPEHIVVNSDANGWKIDDLDSRNGLFLRDSYEPKKSIGISSGQEVYIGKTLIRFISADQPVKASELLELPKKKKTAIARKIEFFGTLFFAFIFFYINQFFENPEYVTVGKQVAKVLAVYPVAIIWASLWAFLSRVTKQRLYFTVHLKISVWFMIAIATGNIMLDYVEYNLVDLGFSTFLRVLLSTSVACWFLMQHLKIATALTSIKIKAFSAIISFGIVAGFILISYSVDSDFESSPQYSTIMKPPFAKLVSGKSVDEYFKANEKIFHTFEKNND